MAAARLRLQSGAGIDLNYRRSCRAWSFLAGTKNPSALKK
jgi:hypothetical protein